MKSMILLIVTVFLSEASWAVQELSCTVHELLAGETTQFQIAVPVTSNAHGSIRNFKLERIPQLSGMVALVQDRAVISLFDEETQVASSGHADVKGGQEVNHQLLLPSSDSHTKGAMISCVLQ